MMLTHNYSLSSVIHSLIPINYFVWLYCTVYLLSPWINLVVKNTTRKGMELLLLFMFALFSIYPTIVDIYSGISGTVINGISTISSTDSGAGYTLVHFIFMYCIGAYIGKYDYKFKQHLNILGYILSVVGTFFLIHYTFNSIYYCNTAVILSVFFKNLKIKEMKMLKMLADVTFPVFIIHSNLYELWEKMNIAAFLSGNIVNIIGGSIWAISVMYLVSVITALCGKEITKPAKSLLKKLYKKTTILCNTRGTMNVKWFS